jgi:hypothetical protein
MWFRVPDWCVLAMRGLRYFWARPEQGGAYNLTETDIAEIRSVIVRLRALSHSEQSSFWLVTSRLSTAKSHTQILERAIDLRIAYEMTFFMGDTDSSTAELRFRLALRAARLLGNTLDERKRLFKTGRNLYDMCSTAIHSGRIGSDYGGEAGLALLKEGETLTRQALKKMVVEGKPTWSDLLLS